MLALTNCASVDELPSSLFILSQNSTALSDSRFERRSSMSPLQSWSNAEDFLLRISAADCNSFLAILAVPSYRSFRTGKVLKCSIWSLRSLSATFQLLCASKNLM